ncbi:Aprataxin-like protein [Candida viswanathii]|uniref:Aprataxin-like protein n=1 Tax=Candida viswanathii TaxID=5486 RepID=A0A367Y8S2_9ASCO|nr:Aprataxin-like protein [Candida viswanathii]
MSFRDAFQKYIDHPETHDIVEYYDDNVIIIKDMFPKAIRHLLVIPRNPQVSKTHPLDAFNRNYDEYSGEELYELVLSYVEKAKDMIIDDLFKNSDIEDKSQLSEFRSTFIKAGVHSIPSLNNLHVHVITQDFNSARLKNKKHYNSFTTKFFVPFEELDPLQNAKYYRLLNFGRDSYDPDSDNSSTSEDRPVFISHERSKEVLESIIKNTPFKCTSCSATFGNLMVKLKEHLQKEYTKKYSQFMDPDVLTPNGVRK